MKRIIILVIYLTATFASGVTTVHDTYPITLRTLSVQQPVVEDKQRNGLELTGSDPHDELSRVDFKLLSRDRLLVSVNDMMYLINSKKEIIWETNVMMVAPPIVDSMGRIFGITYDLAQFSVNARTGEVSYFGRSIGGSHAYFTQIKPYKGNQYLIVENRQFYRDGNLCYPRCPMMNDALFAWRGQRLLWSTDFPPNAELQVWGDKILAVTMQDNSVLVQEIDAP